MTVDETASTTPATPVKRDREEVFVEFTKSVCPLCKTVVDAQVNIRDQKVYLRKRCPEHGWFEALVYGDAQEYLDSARFNKPGTIPLVFQTEVKDGCPSDCGLCPEHKQHACLGIIEVNTGCNLDCPVCFADSGHQSDGYAITVEQCATMLDAFVASEGEAEVVMFSGGEPSIHKHILDFIDLAQARPIRNVNLNTNGIRLAADTNFVAELGKRNRVPGRSVNIYLQFDGLTERTHRELRGRDLRTLKQRALDNCAAHGLTVTLVAAVERGLNEHELGAIITFGLDHPAVRSVAFQPVTHSGRHIPFDPLNRLTNPDVIKLINQQLPQWFQPGDFFPVPCCFPTCRSITYLLTAGEPGHRTVVPIPRLLQVEDYLDYVSNRVMPDPAIREALEKLWSASAFMGTATTDDKLRTAVEALDCADACGVDLPAAVKDLGEHAFMIVVQDFQDPYTLNVKQLMKCCVEEITPDGRLIPFCAYNSAGYREQVRAQMSGIPVAPVAPNALPLTDRLTATRYGSKTLADGEPV
ncbi:putative radical SAM superfamily Fe-S cluster-containing enzyme [Streptacidiphilus sp. MAP12-16]|uniref:radical SAM protein n=1 Tax=Streptacidiphilus sp. MAP12-16 TaxID=3156300 RepID=UPI0035117F5F